jgi:PAS domain S-box-containing protein
MAESAAKQGIALRRQNWRPWLFAALAALLVAAGEQTLESFEKSSLLGHEKTHVIGQLSHLRARIESVINGNLLLIHGLTAVIAAQPEIDQKGFERIARGLVDERHTLRNIAAAPDMVISMIYPVEGNQAAIGLDYRTHPTQRDAAMKAVETRGSVIAGPLTLVQGGTAIIAREPVFLPPLAEGDEPRLWGLVSAVIDINKLYQLAGLATADQHPDLALAIRGRDGTGARGETFFGNPTVFSHDPVTTTVSLPGGNWQIGAAPRAGWGHHNHELAHIRIVGLVIGLVLALMAYLLARDVLERRRAQEDLRASNDFLEAAENIAHIGNWAFRVADARIEGSDESYRIFGLEPQSRPIDYEWLKSRVHPDDRDRHDEYLQRLLGSRPGQTVPEFRYRMLRMDGETRLLSVWVRIDFDHEHKPLRFFGTVQDITESEQMQHDLQARLQELTRWQGIMLGREDRIQQLKREVNQLLLDQGQPIRYPSQADEP